VVKSDIVARDRSLEVRIPILPLALVLTFSAGEALTQPPYQAGWPQLVERGVDMSSPALVDVDGDDTMEVVIASNSKLVYLWNHRGECLPNWPRETTPNAGWGETSSPAVGDIDADGDMEIIQGSYVGDRLLAWEVDGSNVPGFPLALGDDVIRCSATLEDFNQDDSLEICIGTGNFVFRVYLFDHRGTELWNNMVAGRVHSTPAVGDLDNDGDIEIVHGTDDGTPAGQVYAWHHSGDALAGWPRIVGHHVDGGPALVDIDRDDSLEVFVGSIDNYLYGLDHHGNDLPGWPKLVGTGSLFEGIVSSPAVGDIDNDSTNGLEIVVGRGIIQSISGRLLAYHQNGDEVFGFPIDLSGSVTSSPALADIDGDEDLEIFVGCQNGSLYAYHHTGSPVADFPIFVSPYGVTSSPALGDVDLDGDIELAVGGKGSLVGGDDSMYIWDLPGPYDPIRAPWPMFHHDVWHTGLYGKDIRVGVHEECSGLSLQGTMMQLRESRPEPFKHSTIISYSVSETSHATIQVFDISGRYVTTLVDELKQPGLHQALWLAGDAPAGVYFCVLRAADLRRTKRLTLVH
jgi:hypothetical protein